MKLKSNFMAHSTCGQQHIIDATGTFSGLITCDATAAYIVELLKNDTTVENIVDAMCAKYDAPREVIAADVAEVIEKFRAVGAIDE